jgi:hypothetical protein
VHGATVAAMTALWGLLASITGPRAAIAIAGLLILPAGLLLPRRARSSQPERELRGALYKKVRSGRPALR